MTDRIDALERLERLRQSGALSDAEFAAEKARLLGDTPIAPDPSDPSSAVEAVFPDGAAPAPTVVPGPAPSSVESAFPAPAAPPAPLRSTNWAVIALVGILLVLGAIGIGVVVASSVGTSPTNTQTPVAGASPNASPTTDAAAALRAMSEADQARIAFHAVFGRNAPVTTNVDGEQSVTKAVKVLWLDAGPVLITSTEIPDGCHACSGSLGVYYLRPAGSDFDVIGRYPKAVEGWGWGSVPDWSLNNKFTDYPAIYASGGYTGQGYTCESATLTELRPDGPVTSEQIATGADNSGAIDDETGRTMGGDPASDLKGKIVNIVKGRSFDVQVSGTDSFTEHYVRKGNKFVPTAPSRLTC